jgi:hypothetical protein
MQVKRLINKWPEEKACTGYDDIAGARGPQTKPNHYVTDHDGKKLI